MSSTPLSRLLPVLLFLALFPGASRAAFSSIELRPAAFDDLITVDSNTGLEWLDLTETSGMSINDARASVYVTQDGFRVATAQEVEELLVGAGLSAGVFSWHTSGLQSSSWAASIPPDPNSEAADASDALRTFFGVTNVGPPITSTRGRFLRYPGTTETGFAIATLGSVITTTKSVQFQVSESGSGLGLTTAGTGVFLVRSAPASILRSSFLNTFGDDLVTIDDNTRLAWLDLTETQGMSVNDALASTYVQNDGFRVATAHEVDVFFESAGLAPAVFSPGIAGSQSDGWASTLPPFDPNTRAATAADAIRDHMGVTSTAPPITFAGGLFVEEEGSDQVGFARAYLGSAFTTTKGVFYQVDAYPAGLGMSLANYGVFLVRPVADHRFQSVSLVEGENDHLVTRDLNTGLEWLDLTVTQGCSLKGINNNSLLTQNGFRFATGREVDVLMETAKLLPTSIDALASGLQGASWTATFPVNLNNQPSLASSSIRRFFGLTVEAPSISQSSKGLFLRGDGSSDIGEASANGFFVITTTYSINYEGDAHPDGSTYSSDTFGVFLVRGTSAVPAISTTSFDMLRFSGKFGLQFRGAPNTAYLLRSAPDLDFDGPSAQVVTPETVSKGTQDGDYVITDENGEASVSASLAIRPTANFVGVGRP